MQNLYREIAKFKLIVEKRKENDGNPSSTKSTSSSTASASKKTVNSSKKPSPKAQNTKRLSLPQAKTNATRKSIAKTETTAVKPKNTIRSMFQKQLEKSKIEISENSQLENNTVNGTSMNSNDRSNGDDKQEEEGDAIVNSTNESAVNETMLVPGSAHKRLTRRNSMSIQTPTKLSSQLNGSSTSLNSGRKQRRTLFTQTLKTSVEENDVSNEKSISIANQTILNSQEMDVCEPNDKTVATNKCNSQVRQLLNAELAKKSLTSTPNGKTNFGDMQSISSRLRRRTMYTPQPMDETDMQNDSIDKIDGTKRRTTINPNSTIKKSRFTVGNPPELQSTQSCDAILTSTNKMNGMYHQEC